MDTLDEKNVESPKDQVQTKRKRDRKHMPGTKEDVYTLGTGDVILQWPERISSEDKTDLDDWLDIMKRKIGRSVVDEPDDDEESADEGRGQRVVDVQRGERQFDVPEE